MRLKDGFQVCPKCGGQGCYWCRRTGYMTQCPQCMNIEHELTKKVTDSTYQCQVCDTEFDRAGRPIPAPELKG